MISTHILDLRTGNPAAGVAVTLLKKSSEWETIKEAKTDNDGRIKFDCSPAAGEYRLLFEIEDYLKSNELEPFFTSAPITFRITDTGRNYHVPLLLSPYGFSTYRGS